MSVIMQFAIFPTDKHEGLGKYVARVINMLDEEKADYRLTPMATIVETETMEQATYLLNKAHQLFNDCQRVYLSVNIDSKKGSEKRAEQKIKSVKDNL